VTWWDRRVSRFPGRGRQSTDRSQRNLRPQPVQHPSRGRDTPCTPITDVGRRGCCAFSRDCHCWQGSDGDL